MGLREELLQDLKRCEERAIEIRKLLGLEKSACSEAKLKQLENARIKKKLKKENS